MRSKTDQVQNEARQMDQLYWPLGRADQERWKVQQQGAPEDGVDEDGGSRGQGLCAHCEAGYGEERRLPEVEAARGSVGAPMDAETPERVTVFTAAAGVLGFLLHWIWERFWRKKDKADESEAKTIEAHADRLIRVEGRLDKFDSNDAEKQRTLGRLEGEQHRLEGRVDGLQDFWRNQFDQLSEKFDEKVASMREELRGDQKDLEGKVMSALATHQQRIHDRLNIITGEQAKLLTEFVDKLVDKD